MGTLDHVLFLLTYYDSSNKLLRSLHYEKSHPLFFLLLILVSCNQTTELGVIEEIDTSTHSLVISLINSPSSEDILYVYHVQVTKESILRDGDIEIHLDDLEISDKVEFIFTKKDTNPYNLNQYDLVELTIIEEGVDN